MSLINSADLYIGLISGTSMDAIDCALVDFQSSTPRLVDFLNLDIPSNLRAQIVSLCGDGENQVHILGEVDVKLGELFAEAAQAILKRNKLSCQQIKAIGSHGQTIRHQPPNESGPSFTIQIADPNTISALTGITTVADFRRKDMAAGGQGAPLVPAFHREIFASDNIDRVILNIGGMANLSLLKKDASAITGFDTGPGNMLMDLWIQQHKHLAFDDNGKWAASGICNEGLLQHFLKDNYFLLAPPKSTGREYFNQQWLDKHLNALPKLSEKDIQATLLELTTTTICESILPLLDTGELIVCGGGARNGQLMSNLKQKLPNFKVIISSELSLDADSIEAIAFAWLAKQTLEKKAIDYTQITGASHPIIMGGIYYCEA